MRFLFVNMWNVIGTSLCRFRPGKNSGTTLYKYVKEFKKSVSTSNRIILCTVPTADSHPHLLKKGEVTPTLTTEVYNNRRNKFLKMIKENVSDIQENCSHHLVVIPSSSIVYMSEPIPYPFRQFTDFLYFCGYKEANSVLVLTTTLQTNESGSILFVPKQTAVSERWEGAKLSLKDTTRHLGIDRTLYIDELHDFLQSYVKSNARFTLWYDFSSSSSRLVHETVRSFLQINAGSVSLESPRTFFHRCRLLKCKFEAELMRKTCKIGAEAMKEVIKISKPFMLESYLQAKMEYECRIRGADHPAFPPVIAGGSRANTIHYIDNNQIIMDGEMVLMDAGCEYNGYCSDLARTWPVNGKFSGPQRVLYDLILSIQEQLIEQCTEKPSLDKLFIIMCQLIGKGLQDIGILPQNLSEKEIAKIAYEYCPHHVSHYLGMDVHDTDAISRGINLLPGMVVTIEPGIYISKDDPKVPEKYRGICVRIEDDVLITNDGVEVLTSACPKNASEIENLVQSN